MLLVEAAALMLKAWDERQTSDMAALALLQARSETIAQGFADKAGTATTAISLAQKTGASLDMVASATPGVDQVLSLNEAIRAPAGSRERAAAETATRLSVNGQQVGLSEPGDVIVLGNTVIGTPVFALTNAETWLPVISVGHRYSLFGHTRLSFGDESVSEQASKATTGPPRMQIGTGLARAASSCTRIPGSELTVCDTIAQPWITLTDMTRLLIYALLLAGPALALLGLFGTLREQSECISLVESTRKKSDQLIDLVMTGANAAFWQWDTEEAEMHVSPQAAKQLDMPENTVVTRETFFDYVYLPDREKTRDTLERGRELGTIQAVFRTAGSNGRRWVELCGRISPDAKPGTRPFAGLFKDITDRKLVEDRMKSAQHRLRNAVQGFSGPFAIWDKRKRLMYWNNAFAHMFNLEGSLRKGMSHDTVTMARSPSIRQEIPSDTDNHTQLLSLASGHWLKLVERPTPEGGIITVGIDITDNIQAQEQLKRQKSHLKQLVRRLEQSEGKAGELAKKYGEEKAKAEQAAQAKNAFLANMSHELRTPLNAINGFSEILTTELYGPLGDERYNGYAQDILTSGQHLLDMINDILDMAKIDAGKMTVNPQSIDPIDPVDTAVRMIRRRAEEKNVELVLDTDENLSDIQADPRALRQMVLNLVSNAVKFTDSGGRVLVTMRQRANELKVAVTDTGIGISKEDIPRLGKPFEQVNNSPERNKEGTGLGLALTKSFAEMHGGRLTIKSEIGKGTRVAFYLPIDGTQTEEAEKQSDETPYSEVPSKLAVAAT